MKNWNSILFTAFLLGMIVFSLVYLQPIVTYILVSGIFFLMGYPLVRLMRKATIKNKRLPKWFCALFIIFTFYNIVIAFFASFLPLVLQEINMIMSFDLQSAVMVGSEQLNKIDQFFIQYGLAAKNSKITDHVLESIKNSFNVDIVSNVFTQIIGTLGNTFAALFSITFITFFFLTDHSRLYQTFLRFIPDRYEAKVGHTLSVTQNLISRYFIGILIQVTLIASLVTIGMLILDVKYALLIGTFAGAINVIPYLGPLIGSIFGFFIAITTTIEVSGFDTTILLMLIIKMSIVYTIVHLIDNILFQPIIFSSSIKAHPLEIFIVLWVAGLLSGVMGLVLAIPCYTVIRVLAKEILLEFGYLKPAMPAIPVDKVYIDE